MPAKPQPAPDDTTTVNLQIRIPGRLKNQILHAATQAGEPLNTWIAATLHQAVNQPATEPSGRQTPTVADIIADYLNGNTTTAPCGKPWPCPGTGTEPTNINGANFCTTCNVRL